MLPALRMLMLMTLAAAEGVDSEPFLHPNTTYGISLTLLFTNALDGTLFSTTGDATRCDHSGLLAMPHKPCECFGGASRRATAVRAARAAAYSSLAMVALIDVGASGLWSSDSFASQAVVRTAREAAFLALRPDAYTLRHRGVASSHPPTATNIEAAPPLAVAPWTLVEDSATGQALAVFACAGGLVASSCGDSGQWLANASGVRATVPCKEAVIRGIANLARDMQARSKAMPQIVLVMSDPPDPIAPFSSPACSKEYVEARARARACPSGRGCTGCLTQGWNPRTHLKLRPTTQGWAAAVRAPAPLLVVAIRMHSTRFAGQSW